MTRCAQYRQRSAFSHGLDPYPLERLFGRILSPLERFLRQATAGGIVLVATTGLTLAIANSPLGEPFAHFWEQRARLQLGAWTLE
jgi:NhaA family Na+:H+ antiporter